MSLPTKYQDFIHLSRYARWQEDKGRRETWEETVNRYCDYFSESMSAKDHKEIFAAIYDLEVMPSMRALMMAGKPAERGVFSREASNKQVKRNGRRGKRVTITYDDGTQETYAGNEFVLGNKTALDLKVGDDVK